MKRETTKKLFLLQRILLLNNAVDKSYIKKTLAQDPVLASIFAKAHNVIELLNKKEDKQETENKQIEGV